MRIISGKLKGKSILFLKTSDTRPLKDSVRENIFNVLTHSNLINLNLQNSSILDLYSGVGSFGLEALSRGAKSVTFVEKSPIAIKILSENIKNLRLESKSFIFKNEIETFLNKKEKKKYDIFFLDPPFADNEFINILTLLKKNKMFNKKHIIIIHREKKTEDNFGEILSIFLTKKYGRSKILFATF